MEIWLCCSSLPFVLGFSLQKKIIPLTFLCSWDLWQFLKSLEGSFLSLFHFFFPFSFFCSLTLTFCYFSQSPFSNPSFLALKHGGGNHGVWEPYVPHYIYIYIYIDFLFYLFFYFFDFLILIFLFLLTFFFYFFVFFIFFYILLSSK